MANAEMAAAWNGDDGRHWADNGEHYDRGMQRHHRRLMFAARLTNDDEVLDVGCGNGQTTLDAARAAASGRVVGIDLSGPMLEQARRRAAAAGVTNATFVQGDAQVHPFDDEAFDVAVSRFGVMFFADPLAAFTNIHRAVRRGGRLAFLAWQALAENEWMLAVRAALAGDRTLPEPPPGAPSPFALADADRVRAVLVQAGFAEVELVDLREPIWLGADVDNALGFISGTGMAAGLLRDLDEGERHRATERLRATFAAHATPEGVLFATAAWLTTAHRA